MTSMTTCLWFDDQAQDAAQHYVDVFGATLTNTGYHGEAGPGEPGKVLTINLEVAGTSLVLLNGGPDHYHFTEAVSVQVHCDSQGQADDYWARLTADGGQESRCGWLKDRFGFSWQIIPAGVDEVLGDPDPERAHKAMAAMLQMHRLDVAAMRAAADSAG